MEIIEYFSSENKEHWLSEIKKADWDAAKFLAHLLSEGKLKETLGQTALVPLLTDGEKLVSFCTLAPLDDVQPTELSPWIGFVYTAPEFRGNRYAGKLLNWAESVATAMGKEFIYISTCHTGLYEKYGYEFFQKAKDINGKETQIYRKNLSAESEEKQRRTEEGKKWKAEIVSAAKKKIDMTAICGFSCSHCFLGEWCGGCRSVFNCCSFGTMFPGGKCPNVACCEEKKLDGCFDCPDLENCETGFYKHGNDGAAACKAQAIFIHRHGKENFFKAHDNLHKKFSFKKTQEILGQSIEEGLKIMEENL